jgi:glycosyltransferase involved in cell wall biosynthesis
MKCSIVMPAYKAEQFIAEAIESVLDQEMEDGDSIQLIVVADGCEASYRVAESYSSDILCVLSDRNHGAYNSRNLGMLYCDQNSHIIGTLDSDDMWSTNRFIETKKAFNKSPRKTIFSCPSQTITAEGDIVGNRTSCAPSGQNLYMSEIVKALGMYRPWVCGADTEYQMRSYRMKAKKVITRGCTYFYRSHENQLTKTSETGFGSKVRKKYREELRKIHLNRRREPLFHTFPTPKVIETSGSIPKETLRDLLYVSDID